MGSHLCYTHLIEEIVCVAANATLPIVHPVMYLLASHFVKTLSLNEKARAALVPSQITKLTPLDNDASAKKVLGALFDAYDFQKMMPDKDLPNRGFAWDEKSEANAMANPDLFTFGFSGRQYWYGWIEARLWCILKDYVYKSIKSFYPDEKTVETDPYVGAWFAMVQKSLPSFRKNPNPADKPTFNELVRVITMVCLELLRTCMAAPQCVADAHGIDSFC